jgi:hypothetical protein
MLRTLGLLLGLFWLTMTGLLVWREGVLWPVVGLEPRSGRPDRADGPEHSEYSEHSEPVVTGDTWLGLFVGAGEQRRRVGAVHLLEGPEERRGVRGQVLRMTLTADLELFARTTELRLAGMLWRADDLDLAELELRVSSGEATFGAEAEVEGGRLRGTVVSAGESLPLDLPVPTQITLSGGLGTSLVLPRLEVGEVARVETLDPLTLRTTTATVRALRREQIVIAGEPVDALALLVDAGGFETRAWVDLEGEVLRASTPLGLELERISAVQALEPLEASAGGPAEDLLRLNAVSPTGPRPRRGVRALTLRATSRGGAPVELPTDSVQQAAAEGAIRIEPTAGQRSDPPPLLADLGADAFVQSAHPDIVERARAIVAGVGPSPTARAEAIHDWVHQRIDKVPVLSIPSALDVLATRQGDCNEHAVLFTALARAVDLPTRIAIGLVWSDELDGFYYHAWPEVHLDGAWRWMDPTLGQRTADATHVKLLNGGIEAWTGILPTLGALEIEVLGIENPELASPKLERPGLEGPGLEKPENGA